MSSQNPSTVAAALALVVLALPLAAEDLSAEPPAVDPEALRVLKRMTDHLRGLQRFGLDADNTIEEVLDSGQKIQHDFSARIDVERPDKLRAERTGDELDQLLVYDGATLTIHDRRAGYYAVADAPDDIDGALHFARDTLDIVPPSGDMIFTNAFELLTASLTSGMVVGKSRIGGVRCDHLAFRSGVVDWQVWIADGDLPLPQKYVLTTVDDPARPQYVVRMHEWHVAPKLEDALFDFSSPEGAQQVDFIRMEGLP